MRNEKRKRMEEPIALARPAASAVVAVAISLLAIALFLNDLFPRGWQDWAIAGTLVAGVSGAILALKRDSFARALMWLLSFTVVTLLLIYDVLDALLDPFIAADWPIAVAAVLLVIGLGTLLGILISDDE
jgi:hypothetical protein